MQITINGESREVAEGYTAADLVAAMELGDKRIAMEVNLEIVPRSRYAEHRFSDGDRVEVVRAIGGG